MMKKELVESALDKAIEQLLREDSDLLTMDANERSISHRFAIYLEPYFPGWNVDCEYNRDNHEVKKLIVKCDNTQTVDGEAKTVYPDIIVHKRKTKENLVVIEMKKTTSREKDDYDLIKLEAFKNKKELNYQFAIFIKVPTNGSSDEVTVEWIVE